MFAFTAQSQTAKIRCGRDMMGTPLASTLNIINSEAQSRRKLRPKRSKEWMDPARENKEIEQMSQLQGQVGVVWLPLPTSFLQRTEICCRLVFCVLEAGILGFIRKLWMLPVSLRHSCSACWLWLCGLSPKSLR